MNKHIQYKEITLNGKTYVRLATGQWAENQTLKSAGLLSIVLSILAYLD